MRTRVQTQTNVDIDIAGFIARKVRKWRWMMWRMKQAEDWRAEMCQGDGRGLAGGSKW